MIEYEDFSLKIEPKRGEVYPVIVLHSPAGEGRSSFTLPFNPDEIGDILFDLGWTVRGSGHMPLRDVSPAATRTRPQQIGDQLFSALFSGTVRSLLDHSLGMIHGRERGLRIKLHIDPEDSSLAQLASLPWEFLYRKEKREFLNLSRFTPIIRYLDVQSPYTPLSLEPPLRILVVISDPADYERLDLDRERELIETSWAKHEGVVVDFMEEATILALQDRLSNKPYHVLHYMGHGGFDKRSGRGVLVMEDEDGQGAIVDGNTLGILLRDIPTMRLAFLNACETARVTKEKGLDPFAGVAAAMVMAGIPAVVAMQFPVSDRAAITFSQKFYPLLARGEPVDAAVAEGRRAICLANSGTMEWGTPVLFLRAPQGVIFQVSETQREKVPLPEIPELPEEVDQELEQRLAELYTLGLSAFWLEEWEKAIRNFQAIVDVRPEYEDVAEKLAEARQQANLYVLYTQAQAAQGAGDWSGALEALEQITAEAADYEDTKERLQAVRKQKQLADLYDEAQHLHQAQQWQAVVKVFSQIHAIDPDYPDPEGLLPGAEQEASKLRRQAELNDVYGQAIREMNAGLWQEARHLLIQVQDIETDFRDTERLLARVEQEIERQEKEHKRHEQIATYYEQALGLAQAQQWRQVLEKMEEIQNLDPEFADPKGLTAEAREELTKEDEEAQRQNELATLYAEAVRLLEAEQYQKALEKWGEVQARDPRYPDRQNVQANSRKKLEALTKEAPPRRGLPTWTIVGIGGAIILVVVFTIIIGGGLFPMNVEAPLSNQSAAQTAAAKTVITLTEIAETSTPISTEAPLLVAPPLEEPSEVTLGLSLSTLDNPFFVTLRDGAQTAADAAGVRLVVVESQDNFGKEATNIEDLIQQKVDAILVNPTDGEAVVSSIIKANEAGIPVFTVDRVASGGDVEAHIASDNIVGGGIAAKFLCDALGGEGKVVELEGIQGTSATGDRSQGFNTYLSSQCPGLEVVERQTANFDRDEGYSVFEYILEDQPEINATFAHNDEMVLGAIEAAEAAGRAGDIIFIGFDAVDDAIRAVEEGRLAATIAQQPSEIGRLGVEVSLIFLGGEQVETYIPVDLSLISQKPTRPSVTEEFAEIVSGSVGVVLPSRETPRWLQDEARFQEAFDELGIEVEILFSEFDIDKERANVEELITKDIQVIIYTPHDGSAAAAAAEVARDAGVKVVSYDRLILDTEAVDYYVTFDNIAIGEAQGQYLVDNASGTGNPLYLYAGAATDNNAFLFFEGAWNVLQPKIADGTFVIKNSSQAEALQDKAELTRDEMADIIGQITTEWDFEVAKSLAEANLVATTAEDKGDVFILAPNDGTARSIADTFAADSDVSSYVVTGQDAEIASVQYIIDGKQSMTVFKDLRTLSADAIAAAAAFLAGDTPPETQTYNNGVFDVPAKPSVVITVDQSNVQEEIIDSGYWPAEEFTD